MASETSSSDKMPPVTGYSRLSDTYPCPTCRGSGRIQRASQDEYIALIPLTDRRLRPRRTWLKIGLALICCILIFTLLMIFLLPRSVVLSSNLNLIEPSSSIIKDPGTITILFDKVLNFTNYNFVKTHVTESIFEVKYRDLVGSTNTTKLDLWLPVRGVLSQSFVGKIYLTGQTSLCTLCKMKEPYLSDIYVTLSFQIKMNILWQEIVATHSTFQLLNCSPKNASIGVDYEPTPATVGL